MSQLTHFPEWELWKMLSLLVGMNNGPSKDIKDEFNYLSTLEDQDFIDCYSTITNSNKNVFEFIEEHDCFLNLPEVALEEHPLNIEAI